MSISEYFEAIKTHLLTEPLVENFQIVKERKTDSDGHLRVRLTLSGGCSVEFSEYVQTAPKASVAVITYSYHCADADGNLIVRWDNAPHFPGLAGFPHHRHVGAAETAEPGEPMNIFKVLNDIRQFL
jgi:hypothetical protein